MSEGWATIVYGRTYHLDFRFITIPHDFSASDLAWASQHIVATTQQAWNLAGSPRWSLFKNNSYCVFGVTCTVKDLIGSAAKDDRGRPLYVFVGYVAHSHSPLSIPPYEAQCLDNFKILYQAVEQVWSVKNYDREGRRPTQSHYEAIKFHNLATAATEEALPQLQPAMQTQQLYLWQSEVQHNKLLWLASIAASEPVATCLNISGKLPLKSPFLNQSCDRVKQFEILACNPAAKSNRSTDSATAPSHSLSQKLADRAKEDIDLILQQASKIAISDRQPLEHFDYIDDEITAKESDDSSSADDNFGFKTKKSRSISDDWF